MQRASEGGQERLGGSVSSEALGYNLTRDGAHIEDIAVPPFAHVPAEQVAQHRRCVHVEIENKTRERLAVIEDVAVMINAGIVHQHFYLQFMRVRVVI